MDNHDKSFYYITSWDDASIYSRTLKVMDIPHVVESLGNGLPIREGELAIVFPSIPSRQFNDVRELFGSVGEAYPS